MGNMVLSQEQAFLADICANPDEDTPRLVFADWLTERDGPGDRERAEFIRVQIARESLADQECCQCQAARHSRQRTNGPCRCSLAWRSLRQREKKLLVPVWCRLQNEWYLWESPGIRDWWQNADFRHGFIEHVTLKADDWCRHAERLRATQPIREVTLTTPLAIACREVGDRLCLFVPGDPQSFRVLLESEWMEPRYDPLGAGYTYSTSMALALWPGIVFHGPDFPEISS